MANKITWKVDYDINKQSLNELKSSLEQINKLKVSDIMKINDMDRKKATDTLVEIREEAGKVQQALEKAFNVKLGTTNFTTFKSTLKDLGTSVQQVYKNLLILYILLIIFYNFNFYTKIPWKFCL